MFEVRREASGFFFRPDPCKRLRCYFDGTLRLPWIAERELQAECSFRLGPKKFYDSRDGVSVAFNRGYQARLAF